MSETLQTILSIVVILGLFAGLTTLVNHLVVRIAQRKAEGARLRRNGYEERRSRGIDALATIVNIRNELSEAKPHEHPEVRADLLLRVQPPQGEAYQTITSWLVQTQAVSNIQPGSSISVKIDAEDPRIIYPNVRWAKFCWWV